MKSKFKKLLPVMVMAVAVAGAFSTHAMGEKAKQDDLVTGYIRSDELGIQCSPDNTLCSEIESDVLCKVNYSSSGAQLFQMDASGRCTQPLYRPESK
jgi:hypothetical protein